MSNGTKIVNYDNLYDFMNSGIVLKNNTEYVNKNGYSINFYNKDNSIYNYIDDNISIPNYTYFNRN